jgi:hypothetical protein
MKLLFLYILNYIDKNIYIWKEEMMNKFCVQIFIQILLIKIYSVHLYRYLINNYIYEKINIIIIV